MTSSLGVSFRELLRGLLAAALALGVAACAAGGVPAQSAPAPPSPGAAPVTAPTAEPVAAPTAEPVAAPTAEPVAAPAAEPVAAPAPPVAQPVDPLLGPGQIVWETKDSGVAVPDGWRTCAAPEDCELVMATCCDQCNGGKAVSVAKAHVADARAKFSRKGCGACTKRGCSTRAFCDAGRCVMQWQSVR